MEPKNTAESLYKRETDSQKQKTNKVTKGEGGGNDKLRIEDNIHKLLYIK